MQFVDKFYITVEENIGIGNVTKNIDLPVYCLSNRGSHCFLEVFYFNKKAKIYISNIMFY